MFEFRNEIPEDEEAVENLLDLVFSPSRKNLSSYLLRAGVSRVDTLCYVAKSSLGDVIGVVRQWPIVIGREKNGSLLTGPVGVHPTFQGEGVGSALINLSIKKARQQGWKRAILIGDLEYYKNFGFYRQKRPRIIFPEPTDPARILLLELESHSFFGLSGQVIKSP